MSDDSDLDRFLSQLPADGATVGNQRYRESLGWAQERYEAVRDTLVARGLVAKGRGKGGTVSLVGGAAAGDQAESDGGSASPAEEMFAAEEISASAPRKAAAARPAKKAARGGGAAGATPVTAYQHTDATRKNIPPAGLATQSTVRENDPHRLAYDPHLTPVLRYDETGGTDQLTARVEAILGKAKAGSLSPEETELLREALLRSRQPWLEWAGKLEKRWFEVDPVALHIHERVSANAILKAARREDVERDLFADSRLSREEAMQFYKHDVEWANRLILGDSLQVMSSLARREGLAGQVQMIYIDPPYGIKFSSNWQNEVGKRDVKDKNEDLTREPEMIKAYRDTWTLGVHSYLDYLKQRLVVARELLTDSGSVFVQISDENLHRVRAVMDEVFGAENFVCKIVIQKTGSQEGDLLTQTSDFLLWFAKRKDEAKKAYRQLYLNKSKTKRQIDHLDTAEWSPDPLTSDGQRETTTVDFQFAGRTFHPGPSSHWKISLADLQRVAKAERIVPQKTQVRFKKYLEDFPVTALGPNWDDVGGAADKGN